MTRAALLIALWLAAAGSGVAAESVAAGFHPATAASGDAPARRVTRAGARMPAANFVVEWRLQPADARPAPHGDVVITSGSAATGTSGFGAGAVVVGTARPAVPQALRVANGKEGSIQFDRSETHTVYDMAFASNSSASSSTDGSTPGGAGGASGATGGTRSGSRSHEAEVQSHEVVVHRVDGLRVTPHWTHGDTLELDIALTHAAPAVVSRSASPDARAGRDIDFHSTVQASFDEWLTVASVGDGGDELQIRISWR
ncbi:MAG: hypothetical protein ACJ8GJ_13940 [Vitreoscilla sp.]